jgi:hypothetical protein
MRGVRFWNLKFQPLVSPRVVPSQNENCQHRIPILYLVPWQ